MQVEERGGNIEIVPASRAHWQGWATPDYLFRILSTFWPDLFTC